MFLFGKISHRCSYGICNEWMNFSPNHAYKTSTQKMAVSRFNINQNSRSQKMKKKPWDVVPKSMCHSFKNLTLDTSHPCWHLQWWFRRRGEQRQVFFKSLLKRMFFQALGWWSQPSPLLRFLMTTSPFLAWWWRSYLVLLINVCVCGSAKYII